MKDMVAHFVITVKVEFVFAKADIVSRGLEDKVRSLGIDD